MFIFLTPHNFANGPHFVALTQLRATKTGSNICCTHLSYTFSESWVRKDSVGTCPKKFSHWKFSGTERFTKKLRFSLISFCPYPPKKYQTFVPTVLMSPTLPINFPGQSINFGLFMSYIFWKLLFLIWGAQICGQLRPNTPNTVFGHIFESSGVSLKRSCKIQFSRVDFRSIGPPQSKVMTESYFCLISHWNYNGGVGASSSKGRRHI